MRRKLSSLILLLLPLAPHAAARQGQSPQPPAVAFRNVDDCDVANGRYSPRDVFDRMLADAEAAAGKK